MVTTTVKSPIDMTQDEISELPTCNVEFLWTTKSKVDSFKATAFLPGDLQVEFELSRDDLILVKNAHELQELPRRIILPMRFLATRGIRAKGFDVGKPYMRMDLVLNSAGLSVPQFLDFKKRAIVDGVKELIELFINIPPKETPGGKS